MDYDDEMNTLPDPRSRSRTPNDSEGHPSPTHHPELNDELAAMSTKLIHAINHQTVLDDTLSATRHELETARNKIKELETSNTRLTDMMSGDVWVRRSTLDQERKALQQEKKNMMLQLEEEKNKRAEADVEKKKIEQELESLTQALFEEANKMVVRAKEQANQEHLVLQKKNDLLKSQLEDSEGLLKSQQEQLAQLKDVMENMVVEKDDQIHNTAPSSPAVSRFDSNEKSLLAGGPLRRHPVEDVDPAQPLSFQHLIQPVLRTDLLAYNDFVVLARSSRQATAARVSSGSLGGLTSSLGLNGTMSGSSQNTPVLVGSAPQSPINAISPVQPPIPALKDTKFYKRVLAEDIEPTLRLDTAPGLSWLARRTVVNSMADGALVVEPVPTTGNLAHIAPPQFYPCSLCGEQRRSEDHLRKHRFRTSEAESSQRYPLCKYCLGRVRTTCGFLGFLRMVKDGHYRAEDEDQEKAAWEESVRLREQMFWARIGGGVIPAPPPETSNSRRPSETQSQTLEVPPTIVTPDEEFETKEMSLSPGKTAEGTKIGVEDEHTDQEFEDAEESPSDKEPHTPVKQVVKDLGAEDPPRPSLGSVTDESETVGSPISVRD